MNKSELIDKIADGAGITKVQAGAALSSMLEAVSDALQDGDKVSLIGFGTWSVSDRAARTARNPLTGEKIKVKAKKVVKFKVGKGLQTRVNTKKRKRKK